MPRKHFGRRGRERKANVHTGVRQARDPAYTINAVAIRADIKDGIDELAGWQGFDTG